MKNTWVEENNTYKRVIYHKLKDIWDQRKTTEGVTKKLLWPLQSTMKVSVVKFPQSFDPSKNSSRQGQTKAFFQQKSKCKCVTKGGEKQTNPRRILQYLVSTVKFSQIV